MSSFDKFYSIWRAYQDNPDRDANSWRSDEVRGEDGNMSWVQNSIAVE
jgi:hypothetical protein